MIKISNDNEESQDSDSPEEMRKSDAEASINQPHQSLKVSESQANLREILSKRRSDLQDIKLVTVCEDFSRNKNKPSPS